MTDVITSLLSGQILPGAIIVGLAIAFYRKDQELKAVRDANDAEQKEVREWSLKMQERMHEALDKLSTLVEMQNRSLPK